MAKTNGKSDDTTATLGFEARLWATADALRNNMYWGTLAITATYSTPPLSGQPPVPRGSPPERPLGARGRALPPALAPPGPPPGTTGTPPLPGPGRAGRCGRRAGRGGDSGRTGPGPLSVGKGPASGFPNTEGQQEADQTDQDQVERGGRLGAQFPDQQGGCQGGGAAQEGHSQIESQ